MHRLFIYGTLKRGHCRAGALGGQRDLGDCTTTPKYRLVDCGSYPGLIESADGRSIHGELWGVDDACLQRLDAIEGVAAGLYERHTVELIADSASATQAYFYLLPTDDLPDCGDRW